MSTRGPCTQGLPNQKSVFFQQNNKDHVYVLLLATFSSKEAISLVWKFLNFASKRHLRKVFRYFSAQQFTFNDL